MSTYGATVTILVTQLAEAVAKDEAPEYTYLVPTARDQALFKAAEQKMSPAEREERERQWQEFLKKSAANK